MMSSSWRVLLLAAAVALLGACAKKPESAVHGVGAAQSAPMAEVAMMSASAPARRAESSLAYEHMVSIELGKDLLPGRVREIQSACQNDTQSNCTLLDVSVSSNEEIPNGSLRMRLAPGGVDRLIELAAAGGKVASRSTHAEDLAEAVADTERQLALLTVHRDRLSEFMKDKSLKVEQLITVSRELAEVQTQLEQFSTTKANLRRRIDTELLTISLSLPHQAYAAAQTPVLDALRDFGTTLREAFAMVIRFIATIVPWLIVIVPGLVLVRWLWRRTGHWLNRREQRGA